MTHLLATLLTGGRFGRVSAPDTRASSTPADPGSEAFDRMLSETRGRSEEHEAKAPEPENGKVTNENPRDDVANDTGGTRNPQSQTSTGGAGDARESGITLLGARLGIRASAPSLTFMLPAGAGPADLASAIRTQVLRMAATRQLEPGAVDNLRIAISSRELGHVDVDVTARGEKLEVAITASGRQAEAALREGRHELRDGILARTDRFRQVEVKVENRDTEPGREDGKGGNREAPHDRERGHGNRNDDDLDRRDPREG